MKVRRRARAAVLQTLYELDFTDHDAKAAIEARFSERPLPESAQDFARSLVLGVQTYRIYLDSVVGELAPEWPIEQIAAVDRNVLRIAIYELLFEPDIPPSRSMRPWNWLRCLGAKALRDL
jgi:N utilization substance protein B